MLAPLLSSMSTISQCPSRLAMYRGDAPSYTSKIKGCMCNSLVCCSLSQGVSDEDEHTQHVYWQLHNNTKVKVLCSNEFHTVLQMLTSACCSSSSLTNAPCPFQLAMKRGVSPYCTLYQQHIIMIQEYGNLHISTRT